jgi:N-acetylglucosamine-6-sulfatase
MHPIALAVVFLCAALLFACGGSDSGSGKERKRAPRPERVSAADAAGKPNVIFILTDDQNLSDFTPRVMPQTYRDLVGRGTDFSNYVVATPLCCPSRATYMTGDYPHNDGVFSNPNGYRNLEDKFNTLPVWMHNAGYETSWVGKYLQGYDTYAEDPWKAAPGVDDWHTTFEPLYYDYDMADNGEKVHFGNRSRDYYTTNVTRIATDLIEQRAKQKRPLFMTLNNLAPHHGSGHGGRCTNVVVPAPRDVGLFKHAKVPRTPNYDEKDVSDKPPGVVPDHRLTPQKKRKLDLAYGCRLASLRGVDRSNAAIFDALKRTGELDNTVIFFSSDNGILEGQHRIGGKNVPYEEALRQPLAIYAGRKALGSKAVSKVDGLVSNIDFAPTILQLAGAKPCARPGNCRKLDGQSLVPLLKGGHGTIPPDRDLLIEGGKGGTDCLYAGIRTPQINYTVHAELRADGTCDHDAGSEMYDLDGKLTGNPDPYELDNLLAPGSATASNPKVQAELSRLSSRLRQLRDCSGPKECR